MGYVYRASRPGRVRQDLLLGTRGATSGAAGSGVDPAHPESGRERIRDAAITLFGEHGFQATTVKAVAEHAGVSPPLVIHHFGSKAGLRKACDGHVAEEVRRVKQESVALGENLGPEYLLARTRETKPLLRYLCQAFAAGGEEIDELMDRLVQDALDYTSEAERRGLVKPSRNPRHRAALILLQSFGALMLHRQLKRLIGTSPVDDPPEAWGPYLDMVLEIYTDGVLEPEVYQGLAGALDSPGPDEPDADPPDTHAPRATGAAVREDDQDEKESQR